MTDATNSTITPLAGGATFTGTYHFVERYSSISIIGDSDVAGTLYADFSTDGTLASRAIQLSSGTTADYGIHSLIPVSSYFRIRVVNGAAAQATISVQTIYNETSRIALPTSRLGQTIGQYSDVQNTRVANDYRLDTARGSITGRSSVHISGDNPAVAASSTEDICFNGTIVYLTAATTFEIISTDADDTAAGSGCQSVRIYGLDENWALANELVVTAGAADSIATTTTFIRVFKAVCVENGTYGGSNQGAITIKTSADVVHMVIGTGDGVTHCGVYSIPAGMTGYITQIESHVDAAKAADVELYVREDGNDVTTPFTSSILLHRFPQLIGEAIERFDSYLSIPEYSDLLFTATTSSGAAPAVEASMDIILVTN